MVQLLIWGMPGDVPRSGLPAAVQPRPVASLAALRAALDGRGTALVLADAALLEAEQQEVRRWLDEGGALQALLVAIAQPGDGDEVARRLPFLDDVDERPLSPARLRLKLERAAETVSNRRAIRQLESALSRKGDELNALNKIGVALSAERDIDKLLELILSKSREITSADAGSLYLVEGAGGAGEGDDAPRQLRFKLAQNDTVDVPFEEFTIALDETSVAGYVALAGHAVNVADAYRPPEGSPFRLSRAFDEQSGYRTKSMLVVPMRDHQNEVIGVVQLINKKRTPGAVLAPVSLVEQEVVPFATVDEELAGSLASQAAVAFENAKLLRDIKHLFDAFVQAAVTAIEQRDPTTSGHSERVAVLTVGLAEQADRVATGALAQVRLTRDELQELRYAALLHDFGKVGVREKVLVKGKKLYYGQLHVIQQRFGYIGKSLEVEHLRRKLEAQAGEGANPEELEALDRAFEQRRAELRRIWQTVMRANEPTVVEEESFRALMDLPQRTFRDWENEEQPFLTPKELSALAIRRGSLSEEERREIESHVTHTYEFLSQIPWTGEFSRIPAIAWAHHEKLDGSGYPRGLAAGEIPVQSRMMTIADIYDALVAWDRPYKRAVSVEKALAILEEDAKAGKLDADLFELFVAARVYESTSPR